jgi:uroporphyrinogen decarboxylase
MDVLTPKLRMKNALLNQPVDYLPTQINYTAGMSRKMADHFSIKEIELPMYFGNHFYRLDLNYPHRYSQDQCVKFDWWGVGFDTGEEGYFAAINPLAENKNLDRFDWPDPNATYLLDEARHLIKQKGDDCFFAPNFGFALFERAWSLRGFENFFLDMAMDNNFTEELLDRITEIQLVLINRFLDLGIDGGYFGDDYGAQKGLLFSPQMWRKFIKPRLAKLFSPFVDRQMPVMLHSDGQIQQILPDLVEIGLTTINPIQPEVLDHQWLFDNFKGKLSFYGGISTQTVLPNGNQEDVRMAIKTCISTLAPDGTGLLLAPSHRLMSDIPLENVQVMLEEFEGIKK